MDGDELIAFAMLNTRKDIQKILKIVRMNVMREPANLKYRWQHFFVLEMKCRMEKEVKNINLASIEEQHVENYKIIK